MTCYRSTSFVLPWRRSYGDESRKPLSYEEENTTPGRRDLSDEQASSFLYRLESARKPIVKTPRGWCWVVGLVVITTYSLGHAQVKDNHPPEPNRPPRLVNTCVITNNVKRLVEFYEPILLLKAKWTGED
jgi:hypothetical protein